MVAGVVVALRQLLVRGTRGVPRVRPACLAVGLGLLSAGGTLVPAAAESQRGATAAVPAGAGDLQISSDASAADPDAFNGVLVWSRLAVAAPNLSSPGQYRLVMRASGVVQDLPVPASTAPFNPELGPDAHGDTVVAYDRCSAPASGCGMYIYSLRAATERRVVTRAPSGCMDVAPSLWGKNLIFVRRDADADATHPAGFRCGAKHRGLYLLTGNRVRLIRHSTTNNSCAGCGAELRGNVVASTETRGGLDALLRIDFLGHRRGFLIYRDDSPEAGADAGVTSLELSGPYVYWQATESGESGRDERLYRARVAIGARCDTESRRFTSGPQAGEPEIGLNGVAVDRGSVYYTRSSLSSTPPPGLSGGLFQATSPPPAFPRAMASGPSAHHRLGASAATFAAEARAAGPRRSTSYNSG